MSVGLCVCVCVFVGPAPPGWGSAAGRKFLGSTLLQPARSVWVSPSDFVFSFAHRASVLSTVKVVGRIVRSTDGMCKIGTV